ncbi:MAG: tetratricopeptide repeat protein, partial [Gammaproteobacteria bacterium]|nr:tetratricopeptide repeat protein [Gammaproteobacteria bacterium]
SEKEQIESVRKWWRENGKFLVIAIALGLAIGFGWRHWQAFQKNRTENASMIYQSVLVADSKNNTTTAQGGAVILMKEFSSTPYATLGALVFAKEAVAQNDLPAALSKLQWVIDHGDQKKLQQIARINSARILLSQGKTVDALTQLKVVNDKNFDPAIDWVKGDVYKQEGNTAKAKEYYTKAKTALTDFPPAANLLNLQLAQP